MIANQSDITEAMSSYIGSENVADNSKDLGSNIESGDVIQRALCDLMNDDMDLIDLNTPRHESPEMNLTPRQEIVCSNETRNLRGR